MPPLADKVAEYGDPTVPAANDAVVTCNWGGFTVIESAFVAVTAALSTASTVKFEVPAAVPVEIGVPEIVLPLKLSPGGRAPVRINHVYGGVPPLALSVCE